MQPVSLYIHIPFCVHRCGYCDFNTYAGLEELIPAYIEAVCGELEFLSSTAGERIIISTVYFGGGTPSLLPIAGLRKMLSSIPEHFQLIASPEITLEVNPGTVSKGYFAELHSLDVNRISIGMQSANSEDLHMLQRQHAFIDVANAVEWSKAAGMSNVSLDLIYGLPLQSLPSWLDSLEAAILLRPEHLSLYALTLETGTPMKHQIEAGVLQAPDPDLAADMYEAACDRLAQAGYVQYEISNWARETGDGETFKCKHNLQYWRNLPYIGLGAGAHGFINKVRTVSIASPAAYIKRMKKPMDKAVDKYDFPHTPATVQIQPIDLDTEIGETMMMGLRLVAEGISQQVFLSRFGDSLEGRFGRQIERLNTLGLLEWAGSKKEILRLTQRGKLLGNQVFAEFI